MLLTAKIDLISKKNGSKRNFVWLGGSSSGKIVFALLTKIITLYAKPTAIDIWELGLEVISKLSFLRDLSLRNQLDDLIQVFLYIPNNIRFKSLRTENFSSKSIRGSRFVWFWRIFIVWSVWLVEWRVRGVLEA